MREGVVIGNTLNMILSNFCSDYDLSVFLMFAHCQTEIQTGTKKHNNALIVYVLQLSTSGVNTGFSR